MVGNNRVVGWCVGYSIGREPFVRETLGWHRYCVRDDESSGGERDYSVRVVRFAFIKASPHDWFAGGSAKRAPHLLT